MMASYSISSEDIASGAPGYIAPLNVAFSPDGRDSTNHDALPNSVAFFITTKKHCDYFHFYYLNIFLLLIAGSKLTYLFPDERGVRKVVAVELPPDSFATGGGAGMSSDSADGCDMAPFKLFDLSAEGTMSLQEQLRRERMRLFTTGISSYEWCSHVSSRMLLTRVVTFDGGD